MEKPCPCSVCGRLFAHREELFQHVKRQHDRLENPRPQKNTTNADKNTTYADKSAEKQNEAASKQVTLQEVRIENNQALDARSGENFRKGNCFSTKSFQNWSEQSRQHLVMKLQKSKNLASQPFVSRIWTSTTKLSPAEESAGPKKFSLQEFKRWHSTQYALKKAKSSKGTRQGQILVPEIRTFPCGMCNKSFKNNALLHVHIYTHKDEDWFECNKCGKRFSGKYYLCKHKKLCDTRFYTGIMSNQNEVNFGLSNLKMLSGKKKSDQQKSVGFVCEVCEDTYVSLEELVEHKKTHVDEKSPPDKDSQLSLIPKDAFLRHSNEWKEMENAECGNEEEENDPSTRPEKENEPEKTTKNKEEKREKQSFVPLGELAADFRFKLRFEQKNTSGPGLVGSDRHAETENMFVCNVCDEGFETIPELADHKEIHTYDCKFCGERFQGERKLSDHVQTHVKGQLFHCETCDIVFGEEILLQLHGCRVNKENDETASENSSTEALVPKEKKRIKQLLCVVCNKTFTTTQQLMNHSRIHTGERPFKCDFCHLGFTHESNLRRHRRLHTGERPYRCEFCGKKFIQATTLKYHRMIHTNENPFKCDLCDRVFKRACVMRKHRLKHADPLYHNRLICKEITNRTIVQIADSSRMPVSRIIPKKQIPDKPRPFKCDVCGKGFPRRPELTRHYRTHTGEKPFKCHICGNAYVEKYTLTRHMWKHTAAANTRGLCSGEPQTPGQVNQSGTEVVVKRENETEESQKEAGIKSPNPEVSVNYPTDKCKRVFSTPHLLDTHKKSNECEQCGKQFRDRNTRNKHMMIHRSSKEHQCVVCGKAFYMPAGLRRHMTVHTDERRFPCAVCGFAFKEKIHMQRHMRIHARKGEMEMER